MIFRNTRALSVTTEADYDVDRPIVRTPASSTLHDGFLSNQQVQELNGFLEGIAIESRRGQCNPFLGTPGFNAPFSSARYMVFWYGSDGQRAAVTFGSDFRSSCPPGGLLDLFNLLTRLGEAIQ